jgi:hypothetical protein
MKPTLDFYAYLQSAFDFFNSRLFDDSLAPVMFTITRKKNTCGYFRPNGWISENGDRIHEIAMNPQYFITASPLEIYQTLAHEQAHEWQEDHGKPSRRNYHNSEWADKMRSIGLEPISDNGKGTGQKVGDRPISGGLFELACRDFFMAGYKLAVVDRQYSDEVTLKRLNSVLNERITVDDTSCVQLDSQADTTIDLADITKPIFEFYNMDNTDSVSAPVPAYTKKTKYQCPNCGFNLWGAYGLPVGCLDCHTALIVM